MELKEYQALCSRTLKMELSVNGLGLTGEAGEVADLIKKHVGHGHLLDREKLLLELGDVLWYIAAIATDLGADLSQVAELNIDKLLKRYPDGFSSEASINRADDHPRQEDN